MPQPPVPSDKALPAQDRVIYSISRLNEQVKDLLEHSFPLLWVEGEISNFSSPASGHWYLTLKDDQAQVRCAMFRGRNQLVGFAPKNGTQVLVRARISFYAVRGEFQLILEHMEEAGEGALRRAFELLKKKLQAEGLFDDARKKPLPVAPRCIGVITSPTGAAIRDILNVLKRRFPLGEVVVYPVPVQGDAAAPAIVDALKTAARRAECDVLIVARGGGSLEDLWSFNEESVARAIADCPIPVISGVGHEVDFTIADFVADQRAPTPSAAAELASPDQQEWRSRLTRLSQILDQSQARRLQQATQQLDWLLKRLAQLHPGRQLEQHMQRLDEFEQRLARASRLLLLREQGRLATLRARLAGASPKLRLQQLAQHQSHLMERMQSAARQILQIKSGRLALAARALDSLSPLRTLERGYAVATLGNRHVLTDAEQAKVGTSLNLQLHRGQVDCEVTAVHPEKT